MADPHASFLRRYVMLDQPAGNPIFEAMYRDVAKILTRYKNTHFSILNFPERRKQAALNNALDNLAKSWEANHPNQKFHLPSQTPA